MVDAHRKMFARSWAFAGCLLLCAACGSDDEDDAQETYSCEKPGMYCIEYTGSASSIDTIRDAMNCMEMGSVDGSGCPGGAVGICTLPTNGSTGTGGKQHYYGDLDEDLINSFKMACEGVGGGTFSTP